MKRLLLAVLLLLPLTSIAQAPVDQLALKEHCEDWVMGLAYSVAQDEHNGVPREKHYADAAGTFSGPELKVARDLIDAIYDKDGEKFRNAAPHLIQICIAFNNKKYGPKG